MEMGNTGYKALEAWKETEQEWEAFLETLSEGRREKAEEMKECLEDFASAQEKRAYIQGYADCVQVLYHMGILKENGELVLCMKNISAKHE